MRICNSLNTLLGRIANLLDCEFHHRRISVQHIGEDTQLLWEINKRGAAQTNNLAAAGGQEEAVEEVSTSVVCVLSAQRRLPVSHRDAFAGHLALLARKVLEIGVNLALHQTD